MDEPTWVSWFCMLHNHEFFCEVDPSFLQDRFNLYGLKEVGARLARNSDCTSTARARALTSMHAPAHRTHMHTTARHGRAARMLHHATRTLQAVGPLYSEAMTMILGYAPSGGRARPVMGHPL